MLNSPPKCFVQNHFLFFVIMCTLCHYVFSANTGFNSERAERMCVGRWQNNTLRNALQGCKGTPGIHLPLHSPSCLWKSVLNLLLHRQRDLSCVPEPNFKLCASLYQNKNLLRYKCRVLCLQSEEKYHRSNDSVTNKNYTCLWLYCAGALIVACFC